MNSEICRDCGAVFDSDYQSCGCNQLAITRAMPFTGHNAKHLEACLKSITESGLPAEVFDAFLAEYVKTKDLDKARFFAQCEWDC